MTPTLLLQNLPVTTDQCLGDQALTELTIAFSERLEDRVTSPLTPLLEGSD